MCCMGKTNSTSRALNKKLVFLKVTMAFILKRPSNTWRIEAKRALAAQCLNPCHRTLLFGVNEAQVVGLDWPDHKKSDHHYTGCMHSTTQPPHQGAGNARKTEPEESLNKKWSSKLWVWFPRGRLVFQVLNPMIMIVIVNNIIIQCLLCF